MPLGPNGNSLAGKPFRNDDCSKICRAVSICVCQRPPAARDVGHQRQQLDRGGGEESFKLADVVCRKYRRTVSIAARSTETVLAAIQYAYASQTDRSATAIHRLKDDEEIDLDLTGDVGGVDLLESADRCRAIELVNSILFDAINSRALDIHIQPYEEHLQVRFRIDGMGSFDLVPASTNPARRTFSVASRFWPESALKNACLEGPPEQPPESANGSWICGLLRCQQVMGSESSFVCWTRVPVCTR